MEDVDVVVVVVVGDGDCDGEWWCLFCGRGVSGDVVMAEVMVLFF